MHELFNSAEILKLKKKFINDKTVQNAFGRLYSLSEVSQCSNTPLTLVHWYSVGSGGDQQEVTAESKRYLTDTDKMLFIVEYTRYTVHTVYM